MRISALDPAPPRGAEGGTPVFGSDDATRRRGGGEGSSSTRHVGAATFWMGYCMGGGGVTASASRFVVTPRLAGHAVPSITGLERRSPSGRRTRFNISSQSDGRERRNAGVAILVPRGAVTLRPRVRFSSSAAFAAAAGTTSVVVVRTTS